MRRRFSLRRSVRDGTAVVAVTGEVGPDAAAKLGYAIVAAVSGPTISHVIVDLASVESIDESGLESLVTGHRAAQRHGCTLQIASPSAAVITAAMAGLRTTENLREQLSDALLLFPRVEQPDQLQPPHRHHTPARTERSTQAQRPGGVGRYHR